MRGSLKIRHRAGCVATGKDARACKCSPGVEFRLAGQAQKWGDLPKGWRPRDLVPFEAKLIEVRESIAAGEPIKPRKAITLADYAETWFEELYASAVAGRISKLTYNAYEGDWRNHVGPVFGRCLLTAIDGGMVRKFIADKVASGLKPQTVNNIVSTVLSAILSDAVADGLIVANPARQPNRARHGGRRRGVLLDVKRAAPKHLEPAEARRLLAATPAGQPYELVLAALTLGTRRGELLAVRWEWVDFAADTIYIGGQLQQRKPAGCKCGSERTVPMYSGLKTLLGKRRRAEGYVFTDDQGRPWNDDGPRRAFLENAYVRTGLRRENQLIHVLRHTYASILAAGGIRETVVAELMGHKRQGTTSIYTHLFANAYEGVEQALGAVFDVPDTSLDAPQIGVTTATHGAHAGVATPLSMQQELRGATGQ